MVVIILCKFRTEAYIVKIEVLGCLVYYFLEALYVVAKEPNMVLLSLRFLENA